MIGTLFSLAWGTVGGLTLGTLAAAGLIKLFTRKDRDHV